MFTIALEETWLDYPTPDGNAIAVIMTGCEHHCPGCHSMNLQYEDTYSETKEEILNRVKDYCERAMTNKVILIGGDPLYKSNLEYTKYLLNNLKDDFDVCIYTGYSIEVVKSLNLKGAKFFKCGTFDKNSCRKSEKTDSNFILASPNQNFYDGDYNLLSNDGILTFKNNEE